MKYIENHYLYGLTILLAFNYRIFYPTNLFNGDFVNNLIRLAILVLACYAASAIIIIVPGIIIYYFKQYLSNSFGEVEKSKLRTIKIVVTVVLLVVATGIITATNAK